MFSIISVLILKLKFDFAYMPRLLKNGAQILSGSYLGSLVQRSDILELQFLIVPLLIVIVGYLLNCFITGAIIKKAGHFTRKEAMLMTTPAGASDMALISSDIGVENADVIILQVVRAVVVMTLFPQIMLIIASAIG